MIHKNVKKNEIEVSRMWSNANRRRTEAEQGAAELMQNKKNKERKDIYVNMFLLFLFNFCITLHIVTIIMGLLGMTMIVKGVVVVKWWWKLCTRRTMMKMMIMNNIVYNSLMRIYSWRQDKIITFCSRSSTKRLPSTVITKTLLFHYTLCCRCRVFSFPLIELRCCSS